MMPTKIMEYRLSTTNRQGIRVEIASLFAKEDPGTGTGDLASRYIYTVEKFSGCSIQISRPGTRKKSFDFSVIIPEVVFKTEGKKNRHHVPSFSDVISALKPYQSDPILIARIKRLMKEAYDCETLDPINDLPNTKDIDGKEYNIGILILASKWLFIEEDINYWNWSGRYMFHELLFKEGLTD